MVQSIIDVLDADAMASQKFEKVLKGRRASDYIRRAISADARSWISAKSFMEKNAGLFGPLNLAELRINVPEPSLGAMHVAGFEGQKGRTRKALIDLRQSLEKIDDCDWSFERIKAVLDGHKEEALAPIREYISSSEMVVGQKVALEKTVVKAFYDLLRWAIFAGKPGASGAVAMELLGRYVTLRRLTLAETILEGTGDEKRYPNTDALGVVPEEI